MTWSKPLQKAGLVAWPLAESQAPHFILGVGVFPGNKAVGKETHARQEQTKPDPTSFQPKCAGENASNH